MNVCKCNKECVSSPSVVCVETIDGIKGLANTFVYVSSINTVYYVSPCHEITIISSGPVFVDNYDATSNPLGLRAQVAYDFPANVAYAYAPDGSYRVINLKEAA